jgi:hypothetical protein
MFALKLTERDQNQDILPVFAEYFNTLNTWLDKNFNGLKTMFNWEQLYAHLVREVVKVANKTEGRVEKIDVDNIAFPSVTDTIHVCRLLFQALVNVRIGVADGQHRICAMLNLLSGWSITVHTKQVPPKTFEHGDHFGLVNYEPRPKRFIDAENQINQILSTMSTKVMVRTVLAETNESLEKWSVGYSQVREESQAKHKPRVLVDV